MTRLVAITALAALVTPFAAGPAVGQGARPSSGQRMQEAAAGDVPHCDQSLGTISIEDGDDPNPYTQASLAPPSKLLKVLVQRSGCFNIVDRGTGLNAATRERAIGAGLGLQRRSNVGQGQIRAADYVLIAEIQGANSNVSGSGAAGAAAGLVDRRLGGLLGGFRQKKMEANTVLSITNVRTTETIATAEGYAAKNNLSVAGGGFLGAAAGVGGGYDNTDIGRIVTLSFIQAYTKLVGQVSHIRMGAEGTAEASAQRTYTTQGSVAMRSRPMAGGTVVRTLSPGMTVFVTGKREGQWWEVADENDNTGWVLNTKLAPSR